MVLSARIHLLQCLEKKRRGEKVSIYKLASKDILCDNIKSKSKKVGEMSILSILPSNFNKVKIKILI